MASSIAWGTAAVFAFAGGCAFLFSALYEITVGRRPPGILGWELLNRSRSTTEAWSEAKWRRNGFQVVVMGIGLLVVALWAAFEALKLTG